MVVAGDSHHVGFAVSPHYHSLFLSVSHNRDTGKRIERDRLVQILVYKGKGIGMGLEMGKGKEIKKIVFGTM